jgi:hypothetical protein
MKRLTIYWPVSVCNNMRLPGCRFLCRHIALDPAPYVVPAMSLARSNALHSAQKPTVPSTHEIFGLVANSLFQFAQQHLRVWPVRKVFGALRKANNSCAINNNSGGPDGVAAIFLAVIDGHAIFVE